MFKHLVNKPTAQTVSDIIKDAVEIEQVTHTHSVIGRRHRRRVLGQKATQTLSTKGRSLVPSLGWTPEPRPRSDLWLRLWRCRSS